MKQTLRVAALCALSVTSLLAQAEQHVSVAPAWTVSNLTQTLFEMPVGSVDKGAALHRNAVCMSCHGENGIAATRNAPTLAGNNANYLYKTLLDYQSGLRNEGNGKSDVMRAVTQAMSKQDISDLATYYAAQSVPVVTLTPVDSATMKLIKHGDAKRLLTSCAACHGLYGQGGQDEKSTPTLAGMEPSYFIRSMMAYRNGERNNDLSKGMSQFAKYLTDDEIKSLATYYAGNAIKH
jgi:cytochrome c553